MDFISIDVETANADLASICQIGVAQFQNGQITKTCQSLVNPDDYFDPVNVSIHGIDATAVEDAPTFPDVSPNLFEQLSGAVVISHTAFDRAAITAVYQKHRTVAPEAKWLDSAKVVRRVWLDLSHRGYGLANVAERLGIHFKHHDALEDARAAGEIMLRAIQESGMEIPEWFERIKRPIDPTSVCVTRHGRIDGPLHGEVAVFTGALSMPRREAADLAAAAGCDVGNTVTKATTLLIVGDQDLRKLLGHEKSSKHRKAEELTAKGQPIRMLRETDFRTLVRVHGDLQ